MAAALDDHIAVLLVGDWAAWPQQKECVLSEQVEFRRGPSHLRIFKRVAGNYRPAWLLVGLGLDDWQVRTIVRSARAVLPDVQLAMLGSLDDPARYERWLKQNCRVYVDADSSATRLASLVWMATNYAVVVVDHVFQESTVARVAEPVTSLTRREVEVLLLVGRGLRNVDVAAELHVANRTVEFHMSQLLIKLGARNRVEAVERATALGLL